MLKHLLPLAPFMGPNVPLFSTFTGFTSSHLLFSSSVAAELDKGPGEEAVVFFQCDSFGPDHSSDGVIQSESWRRDHGKRSDHDSRWEQLKALWELCIPSTDQEGMQRLGLSLLLNGLFKHNIFLPGINRPADKRRFQGCSSAD